MAKIKKKGEAGNAKNYITRTQAVRKLQISLPDFRRLCIFKGIYPREPRNKKKVSKSATHSTTFYYTKDIQYLLHEPLLNKFRDHKAVAKKISRALGRGEVTDAARLEKNLTPRMALDHIIKERYPTFIDALRDLDDCLSILFLFANLPSTSAVPPKVIALCKRLTLEFEHYLIVSHSLKKSFLSIKGIYYQATIQGQDILWLVPYKFVQRVPTDVDFRIMGTFVEFYTTLLGFVNFRLYTSIGLVYPPKFNKASDDLGGELDALRLESRGVGGQPAIEDAPATNGEKTVSKTSEAAQAEADKVAALAQADAEMTGTKESTIEDANQTTDEIDKFEVTGDDADELPQPEASSSEAAALFSNFTFYLSRETPREPLEFILKAFGCKRVGWDAVLGDGAYTTNEADASITHQIVDRPAIPAPQVSESEISSKAVNGRLPAGTRVPGRTYIQPQWVWDCINQGKLLRPDLYAPGATLPPHLSPWVKAKKGEYDPTVSLEEQEREGEAEEAEEADEDDEDAESVEEKSAEKEENPLLDQSDEVEAGEGMDVAGSSDDEDEDESEDDGFNGFEEDVQDDSDLSDSEKARIQHQKELEAEAKGKPYAADSDQKKGDARKKRAKKEKEETEERQRQMMMMSRSKRKLLEKMDYSNKKKEGEAEKLRSKRRKIEKGKKSA
ncbi:Pescadillo N-terminus-domain-containing protein [Phyllosticta paracitricarpa]|uniref:Pescadillo homolog n=1 Tax=Phyllosticta paracitricarpa TaxID=2016321 RepID=A0ABR1N0V6_9PEZI